MSEQKFRRSFRGRGAGSDPRGRFEELSLEFDPDTAGELPPERRTVYLRDASRSIIATNQSPDLGFDASVNPYRGCEHGCAYCYARPYHEYLGFSAGLDFETRIVVKQDAAALLRKALTKPSWKPRVLAFSGVTDAYQPIERKLRITRACLEVLRDFRNPVGVITKNHLVTRDVDLLAELAEHRAARVYLSIHSLDPELTRVMEPRTSLPRMRLQAVSRLAEAGVPVGVAVGPVIPGLNDHEIPAVLEAAREAGASWAWYVVLRLPGAVKEVFEDWLRRCVPERADRVLGRLRGSRAGKLDDSRFGVRQTGEGPYAEQIRRLFEVSARKLGLDGEAPELSADSFRDPEGTQLRLFV